MKSLIFGLCLLFSHCANTQAQFFTAKSDSDRIRPYALLKEKSQRGILLIQFKQITRGNQAWERHIREKKMLIAYQIKRM